jgi:hypothetical protein
MSWTELSPSSNIMDDTINFDENDISIFDE